MHPRIHSLSCNPRRYCPREGYKVASTRDNPVYQRAQVTVPVRGIRLHPNTPGWPPWPPPTGYCPREGYKVASVEKAASDGPDSVTVPVRGIRLHLPSIFLHLTVRGYCPREGYKVASAQKCAKRTAIASYCPREGYKVASQILNDVNTALLLLSP